QRLDEAAAVFAALASARPGDSSARYNLALCLAWSGRNAEAIEALDVAVTLDAAERFEDAVSAWTLAGILRQGAGAEPLADDFDHALVLARDPDDPEPEDLAPAGAVRSVPLPPEAEGGRVRVLEWLDRPLPEPDPALRLADLPVLLGAALRTASEARFSSPRAEGLMQIEDILSGALGDDRPADRRSTPLPLHLLDAAVWA